jgi:hypothetical protein
MVSSIVLHIISTGIKKKWKQNDRKYIHQGDHEVM